ncbi:MAG: hypothetical protein ACKOFW_15970, partial [Planctomycetaceae bacterium]
MRTRPGGVSRGAGRQKPRGRIWNRACPSATQWRGILWAVCLALSVVAEAAAQGQSAGSPQLSQPDEAAARPRPVAAVTNPRALRPQ